MNKIIDLSLDFISGQNIDAIAVGVLDFNSHTYQAYEFDQNETGFIVDKPEIYFDLASLSKPLINGIGYLAKKSEITFDMNLVLNHKGGLPAWGLLPKEDWEEIIQNYKIKESETLYSDYSALRFMLEFNQNSKVDLHTIAGKFWDKELLFWKDLTNKHRCIQNGFRNGQPSLGVVHDPNAYNLNCKVSHAGMFGTITGVCETLLSLEKEFKLTDLMVKDLAKPHSRFVNAWDTVENPEQTLAGMGCSDRTFGHLGFTGTSIWIDSVKKVGHVVLSNATKMYWYDKKNLNVFRKQLGNLVWQKDF